MTDFTEYLNRWFAGDKKISRLHAFLPMDMHPRFVTPEVWARRHADDHGLSEEYTAKIRYDYAYQYTREMKIWRYDTVARRILEVKNILGYQRAIASVLEPGLTEIRCLFGDKYPGSAVTNITTANYMTSDEVHLAWRKPTHIFCGYQKVNWSPKIRGDTPVYTIPGVFKVTGVFTPEEQFLAARAAVAHWQKFTVREAERFLRVCTRQQALIEEEDCETVWCIRTLFDVVDMPDEKKARRLLKAQCLAPRIANIIKHAGAPLSCTAEQHSLWEERLRLQRARRFVRKTGAIAFGSIPYIPTNIEGVPYINARINTLFSDAFNNSCVDTEKFCDSDCVHMPENKTLAPVRGFRNSNFDVAMELREAIRDDLIANGNTSLWIGTVECC